MTKEKFYYRGKPLEELTVKELKEAVIELALLANKQHHDFIEALNF